MKIFFLYQHPFMKVAKEVAKSTLIHITLGKMVPYLQHKNINSYFLLIIVRARRSNWTDGTKLL